PQRTVAGGSPRSRARASSIFAKWHLGRAAHGLAFYLRLCNYLFDTDIIGLGLKVSSRLETRSTVRWALPGLLPRPAETSETSAVIARTSGHPRASKY